LRQETQRSPVLLDEWLDLNFVPALPEAIYCVIRKNGQRSQEMLERTAAEVVRATDARASQEININAKSGSRSFGRAYVPIIVTTAGIFICDADYDQLDPQIGEVASATIATAPIVRFKKSLGGSRSGALQRSSEVSVVAAGNAP
jgi:hypothetical protein